LCHEAYEAVLLGDAVGIVLGVLGSKAESRGTVH